MKTMTSKLKQTAAVLGIASGLLAGGTASADDLLIECASLDGLEQVLAFIDFANEKDRNGLQGKVQEARDKLGEGKTCDAAYKVDDYNFKIMQLTSAAKPKATDAHPGALECAATGSDALSAELKADAGGCADRDDPPRGKGRGPKN